MAYTCSKCHKKGHNKRSCKKKSKATKKVAKKRSVVKKSKKSKKKKGRTMGRTEKVNRWGKVVGRYKSQSSDKTYSVRRKGSSYSCNCPGWIFKKAGRGRYCRHVDMARSAGKKSRRGRRYHRSRLCRR